MTDCQHPIGCWLDTASEPKRLIWSYTELKKLLGPLYLNHFDSDGVLKSSRFLPFSIPNCKKQLGHLCLNCRKRRGWLVTCRALAELQSLPPNTPSTFITLTVNDKYLQEVFPHGLLNHRSWQLFAKRLRKVIGPFRFLMCGEYGEKFHRPHYHAIIFGHDLCDKSPYFKHSPFDYNLLEIQKLGSHDNNFVYHTSQILENVWTYGNVVAAPVSDGAVAYVSGYILKDSNPVDFDDEDLTDDVKLNSYVRWSRRPGLGYDYLSRKNLVYNSNSYVGSGRFSNDLRFSLIINGKPTFFNDRYLFNKLETVDPALFDRVKKSHENWINDRVKYFNYEDNQKLSIFNHNKLVIAEKNNNKLRDFINE